MHVNIRTLLPKFVLFTALAHFANPDVLVVSESWRRKATKNPESCNLLQRKPVEIHHTIQVCAQTI